MRREQGEIKKRIYKKRTKREEGENKKRIVESLNWNLFKNILEGKQEKVYYCTMTKWGLVATMFVSQFHDRCKK